MSAAIRSPSYPNTALPAAIEQVRKIEAQYRLSPVDREVAAKVLGYSGLNGPSNKALAALAHYGLVERAGKGEMRVTARAQALLHPDNEEERRQQLREAALAPKLFRELQDRWPNMIPPEEGVVSHLSRKGFNQNSLRPAARAFINTLLFLEQAGASESHGPEASGVNNGGQPSIGEITEIHVMGGARVGDWIDYDSGGSVANPEPMRVRAVSDDGKWVFVDDSETGLEMDQVIVREGPEGAEEKAERPTLPLPRKADEPPPGSRKAIFPVLEGDVTLIFPSEITADGLEVLSAYLEVFLQKEIKDKKKPSASGGAS